MVIKHIVSYLIFKTLVDRNHTSIALSTTATGIGLITVLFTSLYFI